MKQLCKVFFPYSWIESWGDKRYDWCVKRYPYGLFVWHTFAKDGEDCMVVYYTPR
jgi:hypothetical protein